MWYRSTLNQLVQAAGQCQRLSLLLVLLCVSPWLSAADFSWQLLERYPHPPERFTQGLVVANQRLYESSGRYGQSFVASNALPGTGKPEPAQHRTLPRRWFAEGLTWFNGELFLLTWRAGRAVTLDPETLEIRRRFTYPGEGWGLTHNGHQLIMSDGTHRLRFVSPRDFRELKRLSVTEHGRPVDWLNELEWVDGWILANIWQSNDIAVINPENGKVAGRLRLTSLYPPAQRAPTSDVLNGLAWDPHSRTLLVTGKLWPELFRLRIKLPPSPQQQAAKAGSDTR